MTINNTDLGNIISEIEGIIKKIRETEEMYEDDISLVKPPYQESSKNFIHYMALRERDIRELQESLGYLGLSRIAKTEGHVIASLENTLRLVKLLADEKYKPRSKHIVSIRQSEKLLSRNSVSLLGKNPKNRMVRIMVTLPEDIIKNYKLVQQMIKSGMNCARINCAHGNESDWLGMVKNIRKASKSLNKQCYIAMDLGGPKIRTGTIKSVNRVIHIKPEKDDYGIISKPVLIWFGPAKAKVPEKAEIHLPLSPNFVQNAKKGDTICFTDTAGNYCEFKIKEKKGEGRYAIATKSAYITNKIKLNLQSPSGEIKTTEKPEKIAYKNEKIILNKGDLLVLHKSKKPGKPAVFENNNLLKPASISCTLPEIIDFIKENERILFDDGKMTGIVKQKSENELVIEITSHSKKGFKLTADKGINFPDSKIPISGLSNKDKKDLNFAVQHSDIIELSFVSHEANVMQAIQELRHRDYKGGIIIKIENQKGFNNLPAIILAAMQWYPAGFMIARGDLAVEFGWKELARVQEEILRFCEAGHMPVIWATQVLETMAKKGNPSRAEITDAAQSFRAECVMLNKGPYIIETIKLLDEILISMKDYWKKKSHLLPSLIFDKSE